MLQYTIWSCYPQSDSQYRSTSSSMRTPSTSLHLRSNLLDIRSPEAALMKGGSRTRRIVRRLLMLQVRVREAKLSTISGTSKYIPPQPLLNAIVLRPLGSSAPNLPCFHRCTYFQCLLYRFCDFRLQHAFHFLHPW